jgi:histidine phosphotransfer protein HptB
MNCNSGRHVLRMAAPLEPGHGGEGAGAPVLDLHALDRLRDLDPQGTQGVLPRVLRAYEQSLLRHGDDLRAAMAAGDTERVSRIAHTLKSSSASVGALRLSRLCAELERAMRTEPLAALQPQVEALIHEAQQVLAAVRAILPA